MVRLYAPKYFKSDLLVGRVYFSLPNILNWLTKVNPTFECKFADIFVTQIGLSLIFCVKRAYGFCPQEQSSFDKSPPLSAKNPLSDILTQPISDLTKLL